MEADLIKFLKGNLGKVEDEWRKDLKVKMPQLFKDSLQEEITERTMNKFIVVVEKYSNTLILPNLIEELISLGKPVLQLLELIEMFEVSTYEVFKRAANQSDKQHVKMLLEMRDFKKLVYAGVINVYREKYEEIIDEQRIALKELSTPIIPVFDRVIVIPIVGGIDTERSKQMMENILNVVVKNKPEIILIDITGVPIVDSMVAFHLIQVVNAIHIVGGKSMLVGIKPEVAQTLAKLGVDLSHVVTLGNLQEGIEMALSLTNRRISEVS